MKTILISGGSEGLGRAMAQKLSSRARVVILAPGPEKMRAAAAEIGCDFVVADVSDYGQVSTAVSAVIEKSGGIDVLINNAGLWIEGPLEENDPEQIARVVSVNAIGPMYLTRAVLPHMKQAGKGAIINVISQAGLYGKAGRSVYHASKWAMTGFTKSLQEELKDAGIAVTGLYPGPMRTRLFESAGNHEDTSAYMPPEEVVRCVEFILDTPDGLLVPELGLKPASY